MAELIWEFRVAPVLKEQINAGKINLTAIVNTHQYAFQPHSRGEEVLTSISHWDHAGGNKKLVCQRIRPQVLQIRSNGNALQLAHSEFKGKPIIGGKDCEGVTQTPKNGEEFKIGDIAVKALYTPCHTQDSICWFMEDSTGRAIFTGDTLFHGGTLILETQSRRESRH